MRGLLTLRTLSTPEIMDIIELAIRFKKGWSINFPGKKMVNLFYENSTRTQYSFQMAMINLGITPLSFNLASSSVQKGETLYDTVRTFEALGVDGIVIRHTKDVYYNDLQTIKVPIFNGGDGTSDHPTQTLLDLMTIYEEFGAFEGLKIALVGDISHSRVAHGNSEVMKRGLTSERVARMKKNAIIMHPAPINRGIEIASEVAECEKSRIYKQMENGVYVRMAVLTMALEGKL